MTHNYEIGDVLTGEVTGIQKYGIFVSLDKDTQGLIHISEFRHGYIDDLSEEVEVGQQLKVKIIDIDEFTHKISLSCRALIHLDIPPFPPKNKKPRKRRPKIGFKTIANKMPDWIDEGINIIRNDQFHIYQKNKK
ncbi:CvfD/Ygs/GSP13 family RNA-binding post-transcriptional regulator [Hutsoniella sourekii]|uniref:CvfD/Ygs/GSP13 family RNA-binding post-transcriptional regulator n=1 Tax=Hutsoniella sourekii TaxID=87650 RepID=UPI000484E990|nr:CvfD/Ygs/GSP13 family RNA-binding post-transcriptional regulator [Hutsoniella sourekii]